MSCGIIQVPQQPIVVSQLAVAQLPTFGINIPSTAPVIGADFLHNGLNWDPDAPLIQGTIATSQVFAATFDSADITNYGARGVIVIADVTLITGGGNFQIYLQGKDPVSGNHYNLTAAPTTITVATTWAIELSPGGGAAAAGPPGITNRFAGGLPRIWRVHFLKTAGTSITASLGYQYVR
jgi:hypothetical protein